MLLMVASLIGDPGASEAIPAGDGGGESQGADDDDDGFGDSKIAEVPLPEEPTAKTPKMERR
jgi:hypothetical protein